MATSGSPPEPNDGFDAVVAKDKVIKGERFGEFKLALDGLQKSDPANAVFENSCIRAWCVVKGRRHSFSFKLPADATIDPKSVKIPAEERKNNGLKVYFKKTSDFQLRNIWQN